MPRYSQAYQQLSSGRAYSADNQRKVWWTLLCSICFIAELKPMSSFSQREIFNCTRYFSILSNHQCHTNQCHIISTQRILINWSRYLSVSFLKFKCETPRAIKMVIYNHFLFVSFQSKLLILPWSFATLWSIPFPLLQSTLNFLFLFSLLSTDYPIGGSHFAVTIDSQPISNKFSHVSSLIAPLVLITQLIFDLSISLRFFVPYSSPILKSSNILRRVHLSSFLWYWEENCLQWNMKLKKKRWNIDQWILISSKHWM